jgi:hypothetical protein
MSAYTVHERIFYARVHLQLGLATFRRNIQHPILESVITAGWAFDSAFDLHYGRHHCDRRVWTND